MDVMLEGLKNSFCSFNIFFYFCNFGNIVFNQGLCGGCVQVRYGLCRLIKKRIKELEEFVDRFCVLLVEVVKN